MGTNMYHSSTLFGQNIYESIVVLPSEELKEKADGFWCFPGYFFSSLLYEQD